MPRRFDHLYLVILLGPRNVWTLTALHRMLLLRVLPVHILLLLPPPLLLLLLLLLLRRSRRGKHWGGRGVRGRAPDGAVGDAVGDRREALLTQMLVRSGVDEVALVERRGGRLRGVAAVPNGRRRRRRSSIIRTCV